MSVFLDYSKYYDLIYSDKDYEKEVNYIDNLLTQCPQKKIQSILELGSGTGKHAYHLAQKGYEIAGIDLSEEMLKQANSMLSKLPIELTSKIRLEKGDVRTYRTTQTFDAAISLFHVLSYQNTQRDVMAMFQTAKAHIKPGGLFIFDCWYGPAVLNQKPSVRFKQWQNNDLCVERVAVPAMHENENRVTVNYHLFIKEKTNDGYHKLQESHPMRYFFLPEIENLCDAFGMKIEKAVEWLTNNPLSSDTWGACFVVRV